VKFWHLPAKVAGLVDKKTLGFSKQRLLKQRSVTNMPTILTSTITIGGKK